MNIPSKSKNDTLNNFTKALAISSASSVQQNTIRLQKARSKRARNRQAPTELQSNTLFTELNRQESAKTEYLAFRLADEMYVTPIRYIQEILKLSSITEVPRAPDFILGIVSVRGRILSVFDLRQRIGLTPAHTTAKSRILLAKIPANEGGSGEFIGLLVDEVLQVYRLTESDIEPTHHAFGHDTTEYITGIGRIQGALLFIIELKAILDPEYITRMRRSNFGGKK